MPVLWAALGELVSEQAGMINPGIEGVMLSSALATTITYQKTSSLPMSLLAAILTGAACGWFFSYMFVTRGANQIITGILFNLLALGATTTIFISQGNLARSRVDVVRSIHIPVLAEIPIIGKILFSHNIFVYISLIAVLSIWVIMRKTWLGLSIRAAGQHPGAVEVAGINIWRTRYIAAMVGSIFPAIGGAIIILGIAGAFNVNV